MLPKFLKMILLICFIGTVGYAAEASPEVPPPNEHHENVTVEKMPPVLPEMQAQENTPNYEHTFLKMILSLVALLVLVFLTYWLFRKIAHGRLSGFNMNRTIKILEKRPLSAKSM